MNSFFDSRRRATSAASGSHAAASSSSNEAPREHQDTETLDTVTDGEPETFRLRTRSGARRGLVHPAAQGRVDADRLDLGRWHGDKAPLLVIDDVDHDLGELERIELPAEQRHEVAGREHVCLIEQPTEQSEQIARHHEDLGCSVRRTRELEPDDLLIVARFHAPRTRQLVDDGEATSVLPGGRDQLGDHLRPVVDHLDPDRAVGVAEPHLVAALRVQHRVGGELGGQQFGGVGVASELPYPVTDELAGFAHAVHAGLEGSVVVRHRHCRTTHERRQNLRSPSESRPPASVHTRQIAVSSDGCVPERTRTSRPALGEVIVRAESTIASRSSDLRAVDDRMCGVNSEGEGLIMQCHSRHRH